ncbi:MAG: adenine phosphoribosyltransferase [Brooklawnia sp.]|jgi:adenine phosphoribosyltransferase
MSDPRVLRATQLIRNIPDFPKPGVQFKDITPLLGDPGVFNGIIEVLAEQAPSGIDVVAGVESRGFLFGTPLALKLGAAFVPIRKPGKLPSTVVEERFDLEYGSSVLAIHTDALQPGQRVLVIDDLLATGGTLQAAIKLVERLQARVVQMQVVIELGGLRGRENLAAMSSTELYAMIETG